MAFILFAVMLASAPAADIGPEPAMDEFIALAEPAVASKLIEPSSATFKWPYRLIAGPVGYYTCGLVRARNNRGGYTEIWVSAVVANGKVVNFQSAASNGMLAYACKKQVQKGELVPR